MTDSKNPSSPLDLSGLKTTSLLSSQRKVKIEDFAQPPLPEQDFSHFWKESLPKILAGKEIRELARAIARAHKEKKPVILGMGAHPIKVGLSPLIIDFIRRGIITALAGNGAVAIHDYELALSGHTSEEVEEAIDDGSFGTSRETAEGFKKLAERCARGKVGLGSALGEMILKGDFPYKDLSIFAQAYQSRIPATVHIALGTDIVHIHPGLDGGGLGQGSLLDFRIFARAVSELEGGVYINLGSAVIMPEVFLKAVSLVRNLGYPLEKFTTANLDFITHYRAQKNVLERPTQKGGRAINLVGHHELLLPLLFAGVLVELGEEQ